MIAVIRQAVMQVLSAAAARCGANRRPRGGLAGCGGLCTGG